MNVFTEITEATAAIAATVGPAVVAIGRDSRGTGVVVAPGTVLTNAHNLRDRTTSVTFADGRSAQGEAQGVDLDGDLAVLAVDTADVAPAEWADAATVAAGVPVFGVARRGSNGLRTTFGTISGVDQAFRGPRGRRVTGAFEHTAPLGRGSSGGPVTDAQGRVLGINTKRLGDGFYLAVPTSEELRARVEALGRGETPQRRRLGVGLAPSYVANRLRASVGLPERAGLLVQAVVADGPAAAAGVDTGDLIVAIGDQAVTRIDELMAALDVAAPGPVTLMLVRGVEERTVSISFDQSADPSQ